MTAGLQRQIDRANNLVPEKPKMEVSINTTKRKDDARFDLRKLNKDLFK